MVKKYLFLILLFVSANLFSDYKKEQILMREANRYFSNRDYKRANEIYKQILKLNNKNTRALENYINSLLSLKKPDEAEKLLADYKKYISNDFYIQNEFSILLYKGELKRAEKLVFDFLKTKTSSNLFPLFANICRRYRQYELAEKIFIYGRKKFKDNNLFTSDLASLYQMEQKYKKSLFEYLKIIKNDKDRFFFVKYNILNLVKKDSSLVELLKKPDSDEIKTLYVLSLFEIGNAEKALEASGELPTDKLEIVIKERQIAKDYNNAVKLLKNFARIVNNAPKIADAKIQIAKLYMQEGNIKKSKEILMQIYNDEKISSRRYNRLTNANVECRKMLSQIALMEHQGEKIAIKYLKEAKKLAFNIKEQREIDLKIFYLSILNSRFKEAEKGFEFYKNYPNALYYKYLIYALQADKKADTLLVDLMLKQPDSNYTNEALMINFYLSLLPENSKNLFINAYRNKKLYNYELAHKFLWQSYQKSGKEEFLYLSMQWYIQENGKIPQNILNTDFKNKYIKTFVEYLKTIENEDDYRSKAINFLAKNPSSIFSPELRRSIDVNEQAD